MEFIPGDSNALLPDRPRAALALSTAAGAGVIVQSIRALMLRELRALERQVNAYGDEADLWALPGGTPNSTGTIVLHLAGNLRHFIGARLGRSGYVRQRDLEFSRRNVGRAELLREIDAARSSVDQMLDVITDADLANPYPDEIAGAIVSTGEWLLHLTAHLGYHLGQVDYHRRVVTGDRTSMDALSIRELPSTTAPTAR